VGAVHERNAHVVALHALAIGLPHLLAAALRVSDAELLLHHVGVVVEQADGETAAAKAGLRTGVVAAEPGPSQDPSDWVPRREGQAILRIGKLHVPHQPVLRLRVRV